MPLRGISINKEIYNKPLDMGDATERTNKVSIELFLPPTDVPDSVQPSYKANKNIFVLDFKYTTKERAEELFYKDNVKLFIGANSGKPLRIEIRRLKEDNIGAVELRKIIGHDIKKMIDDNLDKVKVGRQKSSLRFAGEVLEESAEGLTAQLV